MYEITTVFRNKEKLKSINLIIVLLVELKTIINNMKAAKLLPYTLVY